MSALWSTLARTARAMVGLPDYDTYCRHMAQHHPGAPVMDRTAFFRDRQQARYGGKGGGRCC
ncbi:CstA-like transporter-associated (seleno)protein [Croceibacterium sp. TMG7-5b_MA50]|uniref:YbdD/YjiX family protein n=1 Tax=Croceibacterium sp. TMG7-5b_MA50 TaxID=3121290 RepID=UPI00322191D4